MTGFAPRWFEEFEVGQEFVTGRASFSESSIIDFALHWDPQPFHIDKIYAENSIHGGLIASGFQTQMTAFRLVYATGLFGHNRGGRGVDDIRWPMAVRPGDTIQVRMTVSEVIPQRTTGYVNMVWDVRNQDDATVMTGKFNYVIAKRPVES